MFLVSFLVSLLDLAPSSSLRHLSIGLSFVDVPGLVAGRGPEPPFATHTFRSDRASQMSPVSFLVSYLNLAPSSRLRHLSIRSSSVDVSDLVSGLGSGLVFQPGSEIPFATAVDEIDLRG